MLEIRRLRTDVTGVVLLVAACAVLPSFGQAERERGECLVVPESGSKSGETEWCVTSDVLAPDAIVELQPIGEGDETRWCLPHGVSAPDGITGMEPAGKGDDERWCLTRDVLGSDSVVDV